MLDFPDSFTDPAMHIPGALDRILAAVFAGLASFSAASAPPRSIVVGELTLQHCNSAYDGYCGSIERSLDPVGHAPGTITVGFEFYPRTDPSSPSLGTILPQEGGPGWSSTGTREAYLGLFASLRNRRDVLIIDKRGTGRSGPLDCPALQARGPADLAAIRDCARLLGASAWRYGTVAAVADVIAVLDALHIARVDYYGDSYGTYFGQVLAAKYPARVRSMVLDGAYPVRPPDAWFATDWWTAREGYDLACARTPSCANFGASASARLDALLQRVRAAPVTGPAPDAAGVVQPRSIDAPTLFRTLDAAGDLPTMYRDFDASARAFLDEGDALPLLRLAAEAGTRNPAEGIETASYSGAVYSAVTCQEYPLLYSLADPPERRRAQYLAEIQGLRATRPGLFAPFTIDEALESHAYITPLDACLDWPNAPDGYAQGDALPVHPVFSGTPVLVLSGELDSVASPVDGARAAAQFPAATHLVVPNLGHVTAFSDEGVNFVVGADLTQCVGRVVRHFVETLEPGETGCVARIRPIRAVAHFARTSRSLDPLTPGDGNDATDGELRLGAAALETVGDALSRFFVSSSGADTGLRGGRFTFARTTTGASFDLDSMRWTEDVAVSGTIGWDQQAGTVHARVTLVVSDGRAGDLDIAWDDRAYASQAQVSGRIAGHRVRAHRYAP
jgi:pimeloyl-ACP methyl ester carboxylesterase